MSSRISPPAISRGRSWPSWMGIRDSPMRSERTGRGSRSSGVLSISCGTCRPRRLREELTEDVRRMIYGETAAAVEQARARFTKKWQLRCPAVLESLKEAGDELFTFLRFPRSQWKALRTTNALERINEEFRRRTKTQASLPSQDAVLLLLFGLLRSGQIKLRALDGHEDMKEVKKAA